MRRLIIVILRYHRYFPNVASVSFRHLTYYNLSLRESIVNKYLFPIRTPRMCASDYEALRKYWHTDSIIPRYTSCSGADCRMGDV